MNKSEISLRDAPALPRRPEFSPKLRSFLCEHGIMMKWVARRCRIDYNRFFRLCQGETEPTLSEGFRIRRALNCQLEQIFDVDETLSGEEAGHD